MNAELVKTSFLASVLVIVIGVLLACSAVLLGFPTPVSLLFAAGATLAVGWGGVRYFTPWGRLQGEISDAQKKFQANGDVSDLIRLRLEHAQYGEVKQVLDSALPADCVARNALEGLVSQLEDTRLSLDLIREKAVSDFGQQQLLDDTNDFIVAGAIQARDIHRHNYVGTETQSALNKIAGKANVLTWQLLACKTELVGVSGRDSWDEQRLGQTQRTIQSVILTASHLNRDPFEDLDDMKEVK